MLKRVKIQGYKSLVNIEVHLTPLCVLFGPNASGKSNFLDALQLLSRIVSSSTFNEAFAPPHRGKPIESFSFGVDGLAGLLAQKKASLLIEVDIELSPHVIKSVEQQVRERQKTTINGHSKEKYANGESIAVIRNFFLRYRIEIEIFPESGILHIANESLVALDTTGNPDIEQPPFLERVGDDIAHVRDQSELIVSSPFFKQSAVSPGIDPLSYPHLFATYLELKNWRFFYFEPRERMHASHLVEEVRHLGMMGEGLAPFLNTLKVVNPSQFRAIEKALHLMVPSITGINIGVNKLTGEVELKLLEGDTPIPARIISEGTLRILGLLALEGANSSPTLIGFEEPENGIHPRRIRLIAELLKTRTALGHLQLIVTTHSPTLLDFIPSECLYLFHKHDGCTEIEPLRTWSARQRRSDLKKSLDDEEIPVSKLLLRGDLDA